MIFVVDWSVTIDPLLLAGHGVVEITEEVVGATAERVYERRKVLKEAGNDLASPYGMVQERVDKGPLHPWRIVVTACLMNRTHARQVRPILRPLFEMWPTPVEMAHASMNLEDLIRSLGFGNKRAPYLRGMSRDYSCGIPARTCYGVGQFGRDCIDVFVNGIFDLRPKDGYLAKYCDWVNRGRIE